MKKSWWPSGAYEARPWMAIAAGVGVATFTFASSRGARGEWTFLDAIAFLIGCGLCVYGGVVIQTRREYRRRSKWHRDNP